MLRKARHRNLVQMHGVMKSSTRIFIAMELVAGGELFDRIADGPLPEDVARFYFHQLMSGAPSHGWVVMLRLRPVAHGHISYNLNSDCI